MTTKNKKLEDELADEISAEDKIDSLEADFNRKVNYIDQRLDLLVNADDNRRWKKRENRDTLLFSLQVGCWVLLIVSSVVILLRHLKKGKYELS